MTDNDDSRRRYRRTATRSRRSVLAAGATCIGTAVTGCSSITGSGPAGNSPSGTGVFQNIGFEGQHMVIDLANGHSVERVNLIGPDGSEFASRGLAEGANRTKIQLFDISPESGDYSHYKPGEYTLVAVKSPDSQSTKIPLEPRVEIVGAAPFTNQNTGAVPNAAITVKNRGSAPTWIYDVAFADPPNSEASEIGSNPGTPEVYLKRPESALATVVGPGDNVKFVSSQRPFLLESRSSCKGGSYSGKVTVVIGTKREISQPIEVRFTSGVADKETAASWERYLCKSAEVNLGSNGGESSE